MKAFDDPGAAQLERIGPELDEAIGRLSEEDQAAILLRFFERQDLRAVGRVLGISEDAARMRVKRALEKLHAMLEPRGLRTALATGAASVAPAHLAVSVAAAALSSTAAGASTSTLTIFHLIAMNKAKATIIGALVLAGVGTHIFLQQQANARLRSENELLRQQSSEVSALRTENERLALGSIDPNELARLRNAQNELLRLRAQGIPAAQRGPSGNSAAPSHRTAQGAGEPPFINYLPAADWRNVGTATPDDALQTLFWASMHNDTNAFLQTLIWDPGTKASLESLFAAAPDHVRKKLASLDGMIYEMALGGRDTKMTGFGIVSVEIEGGQATVIEEHQYEDGTVRQNPIKLVRESDGWRILLDEHRLEKLGAYLRHLSQN